MHYLYVNKKRDGSGGGSVGSGVRIGRFRLFGQRTRACKVGASSGFDEEREKQIPANLKARRDASQLHEY